MKLRYPGGLTCFMRGGDLPSLFSFGKWKSEFHVSLLF